MGKKPIVSVTYENERILIKNSLPYLKCVLRLSCVVHGPIYGRFMGFYVNGFLSKNPYIFGMLRNNADARRCSYFELGLPVDEPQPNLQFQFSVLDARGGGGNLGISGWGCAAGTLEPLTFTRASSAEFCYPILE